MTSPAVRKPHRGYWGGPDRNSPSQFRFLQFYAPLWGDAGSATTVPAVNWGMPIVGLRAPGSTTAPQPIWESNEDGDGLFIDNDDTTDGTPAHVGWTVQFRLQSEITIAFTMKSKVRSAATTWQHLVTLFGTGGAKVAHLDFLEGNQQFRGVVHANTDTYSSFGTPDNDDIFTKMVPIVWTWKTGVGSELYYQGRLVATGSTTAASGGFLMDTVNLSVLGTGLKQREGCRASFGTLLVTRDRWTAGEARAWSENPYGYLGPAVTYPASPLVVVSPPVAIPTPSGTVSTPSETQIANAALTILGERHINSLDDPTRTASLLNDRFYEVRDELLRILPWNFAQKRAKLPRDSDPPIHGYGRQYTLPTDSLRLVSVGTVDQAGSRYTVEGRKILSNELPPLDITYTQRVEDPLEMDALFRQAFAALLAVDVAEAITGSSEKFRQAFSIFTKHYQTAAVVNGQEAPKEQQCASLFLGSRGWKFWKEDQGARYVFDETALVEYVQPIPGDPELIIQGEGNLRGLNGIFDPSVWFPIEGDKAGWLIYSSASGVIGGLAQHMSTYIAETQDGGTTWDYRDKVHISKDIPYTGSELPSDIVDTAAAPAAWQYGQNRFRFDPSYGSANVVDGQRVHLHDPHRALADAGDATYRWPTGIDQETTYFVDVDTPGDGSDYVKLYPTLADQQAGSNLVAWGSPEEGTNAVCEIKDDSYWLPPGETDLDSFWHYEVATMVPDLLDPDGLSIYKMLAFRVWWTEAERNKPQYSWIVMRTAPAPFGFWGDRPAPTLDGPEIAFMGTQAAADAMDRTWVHTVDDIHADLAGFITISEPCWMIKIRDRIFTIDASIGSGDQTASIAYPQPAADRFIIGEGHNLVNGDGPFRFKSVGGGVLPPNSAGPPSFEYDTDYYIVNRQDESFQLEASVGGGFIPITGEGSGVNQLVWADQDSDWYLGFSLLGLNGSQGLEILKSSDHGTTFTYVGKMISREDAEGMGEQSMDGWAMYSAGGRDYLIAAVQQTPSAVDPTTGKAERTRYHGSYIFEIEDITTARVKRRLHADGLPEIMDIMTIDNSLASGNHGGGQAGYWPGVDAIYYSQIDLESGPFFAKCYKATRDDESLQVYP